MYTPNPDRLGYYMVGWKKFYHKTLALIESNKTKYRLDWIFNDAVYSGIDWSVPVLESLDELYKRRAQQIRDSYDYVTVYFSGGADSGNMLRAFVNNNIFIDEIVMQLPEPAKYSLNNKDKSSSNVYSEIEYSAIPILNDLKNQISPNTKVRIQDTSKGIIDVLNKETWFETNPLGISLAVNPLARNVATATESHILRLCDSGKSIVQVIGTDKPLLLNKDNDYYFYFLDSNAMHTPPLDHNQLDMYNKSLHTEFFYWTPDCPEIVIKQAQEVKLRCEVNLQIKNMICDTKMHIEKLRPILHPIIYPSSPEVPFQVGKANMGVVRVKDRWFWDNASELHKNNFKQVADYLSSNISSNFFKDGDINQGFTGMRSRLYKL